MAISTVARINFRFVLVWRLRNTREIMALVEELSAIHPKRTLLEMCETAIDAEPHSFWFVHLIAKSKRDMFCVRFDHKMVLD